MSFTLEHHGSGAHAHGSAHGSAHSIPSVVYVGGGVLLLVLVLVLSKGGKGGAVAYGGSQPSDAAYSAVASAYSANQAALAQQRSDALKGALSYTQLQNDYTLALGDQDIKRESVLGQLRIQDKQVTGALENDRLDIQSRERVSLTQISSQERAALAQTEAQRQVGLAQVDGQVRVGLAGIDVQKVLGLAQIDVQRREVDNNFTLGKLKITTDDALNNKALDKQFDFMTFSKNQDTLLAQNHEQNQYSLGMYDAQTKRQGTWLDAITNIVPNLLKLFTGGF